LLWIGEDTGNHVNNMIWRDDPATKELKRFATLPIRAKATAVMPPPGSEMFMSVQHSSVFSAYPLNQAVVIVINGWDFSQDVKEMGIPKTMTCTGSF
jgi:secreted PhoX family phosphatase